MTTADTEAPKKKLKKHYTAHPSVAANYISAWERIDHFKEWLRPCPSNKQRAKCIACNKELTAFITTLKRHGNGEKHQFCLKAMLNKDLFSNVGSDGIATKELPQNKLQEFYDNTSYEECITDSEAGVSRNRSTHFELTKLVWTKDAEFSLINRVRSCPLLWNVNHPDFRKMTKRKEQYQEIASFLMNRHPELHEITAAHVQMKFKNLKYYYERERRKVQSKSSECGSASPPPWLWYKSLAFLGEVCHSGSSSNNDDMDASCLDDALDSDVITLHVSDPGFMMCETPISEDHVAWERETMSQKFKGSTTAQQGLPESTNNNVPPKKLNTKKIESSSSSDVTALAISHLQKTMEQEQDFAFGIGLAITNYLRNLSTHKQVEMASKLFSVMNDDK